eukprot:1136677-Pelagomonas_calceolata.AAC.1
MTAILAAGRGAVERAAVGEEGRGGSKRAKVSVGLMRRRVNNYYWAAWLMRGCNTHFGGGGAGGSISAH